MASKTRFVIRPAAWEDQEAIARIRTEAIFESPRHEHFQDLLHGWAESHSRERTGILIHDECMLVGMAGREIVATGGLDLDGRRMTELFVLPQHQGRGLGHRLVTAVERLAVRYGVFALRLEAPPPAIGFFTRCGYAPVEGAGIESHPRIELEVLPMERSFPRRQTRFGRRVGLLSRRLGIPLDYGARHRLALQPEARSLVGIGRDLHGREQRMLPEAARAWQKLRRAATADGVELQLVSAYRSAGYQASIIERKLHAGQSMDAILRVSAAPGYSEHHSGRALDLSCPGFEPLHEAFEDSEAFEWLSTLAPDYGFHMTFPRNNRHGLAYEPWHWAWHAHAY
ncbi:MAG: GNAT family N-acetyltransferase [Xanthomonadales bacterium]|nr:GNAT family N-acetyltransferase [Xanthomonadales bacterium]NIN60116.1 GNAT family N-acetyltransferase [Xanthomonadales bacterium]NIN75479.1 GNAT family N-acetyltransferase [Xanthomonadales bacterium]NIO14258.1 GNAT family N-acetyltransferase [Xanthomonadales bacterium]NIP12509.1 GNAT family N-acetyltransferase [Xanthomonadales bacterium]